MDIEEYNMKHTTIAHYMIHNGTHKIVRDRDVYTCVIEEDSRSFPIEYMIGKYSDNISLLTESSTMYSFLLYRRDMKYGTPKMIHLLQHAYDLVNRENIIKELFEF